MSLTNPRTRLLVRGPAALIAMAGLWWLLLPAPLIFVFRHAAQFLASASCEESAGTAPAEWKLLVPVDLVIPGVPSAEPSRMHSVEFSVAHSDFLTFTVGLPIFWALMLAVPWNRKHMQPLIWGTVLTAALEIASLVLYLKTSAHVAMVQNYPSLDRNGNWFYFVAQYVAMNGFPNVIPFAVALTLHRELRQQILGFADASERPGHAGVSEPKGTRPHPGSLGPNSASVPRRTHPRSAAAASIPGRRT